MTKYFLHRPYPLPDHEDSRVQIAQELAARSESNAEPGFRERLDRICELARVALDMDRAFVSLVLEEQQHFIAKANLDVESTPREIAFCAHAITQRGALVVEDTWTDVRFRDNPLVHAPMHLRFYAGTPLLVDERAVGTFCVAHGSPRVLDAKQLVQLEHFSALVRSELQVLHELENLRRQSALLRQSERLAEVGGWEVDLEARQILWSREAYHLHGVDPALPVRFEQLADFYPNGEAERLYRVATVAARTGEGFELELRYVTAAGAPRVAQILAEAVPRAGRGSLVTGVFRDVTQLRAAEAEREAARTVDVTTGLSNGVRLQRHLQGACTDQGGVLVALGLDRFEVVNESLGRAAGDRMLRGIGLALEQVAPLGSTVARIGSDELAVLLPGKHDGLEILRVVGALREAVESASTAHGLLVTASLGVSVAPDDAHDPDEWLHCADIALRTAKRGGGNRVEYFAPALRTRIEGKTLLLQDVRRGLAADEFELYYQPICGVNGIARGFEGLMRWNHPERGLLAPGHFMIAFDDPELALGLGRKALDQSLAQMQRWGRSGHQYGYVALNLSSVQLAQDTLAAEVSALLAQYGIAPHRLMLEVTESVYLDDGKERIARSLNELRQLGVSFALDDFGTGYASLTHLKEFAIDRIKVDQTFVRELTQNAESRAIIRAVLWLGKALGMQVVAEGVETAEQLEFLMDVGCELVQGYYFARPMPAADAIAFCRQAPGA